MKAHQLDAAGIIASDREVVERWVGSLWNDAARAIPPRLAEAMAYSLMQPSKRIRPILAIEAARIFTEDIEDARPFACAIEMIHTYSLIHDDLPAMDDDDLRRGLPTNHTVHGEALAILAGDGLLTLAFETAASGDYYPAKIVEAIRLLAACAGGAGMVGGQVLDIGFETLETVGLDEIATMSALKTGKLFTAACAIPAVLFGVEEDVERMKEFGRLVGLGFQAADDLLDLTGDEAKTGKGVGKDLAGGKKSFAYLYDAARIKAFIDETTASAIVVLGPYGKRAAPLTAIAHYLTSRNA